MSSSVSIVITLLHLLHATQHVVSLIFTPIIWAGYGVALYLRVLQVYIGDVANFIYHSWWIGVNIIFIVKLSDGEIREMVWFSGVNLVNFVFPQNQFNAIGVITD